MRDSLALKVRKNQKARNVLVNYFSDALLCSIFPSAAVCQHVRAKTSPPFVL